MTEEEGRPYQPETWRDLALRKIERDAPEMPQKKRGALIGWLDRTLGSKQNRYLIFTYLFTPYFNKPPKLLQSVDLSTNDWVIIEQILETWQDPETGEWYCHPAWDTERGWLFSRAVNFWLTYYESLPEGAGKIPPHLSSPPPEHEIKPPPKKEIKVATF